MKRIALLLACAFALPAQAQTHKIELTDQQVDAIIQLGGQCLAYVPYACADYAIYIRNLLNEARKKDGAKEPK